MATIMIGSARIDERGKLSDGVAGDQKQVSSSNDTKGEVSMQPFYVHSKGWYILRPKSSTLAAKMAERMIAACNNKNIGYDQGNRLGVIIYESIPRQRRNVTAAAWLGRLSRRRLERIRATLLRPMQQRS